MLSPVNVGVRMARPHANTCSGRLRQRSRNMYIHVCTIMYLEHRPALLNEFSVAGHKDGGVADVSGHQRASLVCNLAGDFQGLSVEFLDLIFAPH